MWHVHHMFVVHESLCQKILFKVLNFSFLRHLLGMSIKGFFQAFWGVLIDLIIERLGLIIMLFDNQTDFSSSAFYWHSKTD